MTENYRIAIVGAGSLRGKELNEALGESAFAAADFVLLDDESSLGKIEAVGDEVTVVQVVDPRSFDRADFVFFAGRRSEHTQALEERGAVGREHPGSYLCARGRAGCIWCARRG